MSLHRRIKDVDPSVVGVDAEVDFSHVDHLPPKTQELYALRSTLVSVYFLLG